MSHFAYDSDDQAASDRPIRVTHLLKGLGPGGAERLVLNQILSSDGSIEYSVLRLIEEKNHLVSAVEKAGARSVLIPGGRIWPFRLRRAIAELDPDIVHAHSPVLAAAVRVLSRLGLIDATVITTEHNRWPRHHRATRLANRLTAPVDTVRFAVSDDVRSTMDNRLRNSTIVLDHGVPIDQLTGLLRKRETYRDELQADASIVLIGIVANFRPEKAYDIFLKAADIAARSNENLRFVVIGQGPGEAAFRRAVTDANLDDTITVLGYREDAVSVMSAFDVFTLTSRHEGKPVSIMEAMALGLPIVATRAGGIPEAVRDGENAFLVDIDDADGLASRYQQLAEDQELRSSMSAASAEISIAFDASRATRSIESAYHGAVDTGT